MYVCVSFVHVQLYAKVRDHLHLFSLQSKLSCSFFRVKKKEKKNIYLDKDKVLASAHFNAQLLCEFYILGKNKT